MKYIIKITNKVTLKLGSEHLIDEGLNDILSGKLQRDLTGDTILKCTATGRRLSENSAIMEVWLHSNESPIDEIKESFNAEQDEEHINKMFSFWELKIMVTNENKKIYESCETFNNGKYDRIVKEF